MKNPRYFDDNEWFTTKINSESISDKDPSTSRILDPIEFDWYQSKVSKIYYVYIGSRWNLLDFDGNNYKTRDYSIHDLGYSNDEW